MAQFSFNEEQTPSTQSEPITVEQPATEQPVETVVADNEKTATPKENIVGLSAEELNDYNKISVVIADKEAPIVVLFGPPACGKTMTLVRLTRYLSENGYIITPVRTFRPSHDANYSELCENFSTMINQDDAAKSTGRISFMLVKVSKPGGGTICQLLEAPGEFYFNPKAPNAPFPRFFNAIKASKCRKIWSIMVEPDWMDEQDRLNYVARIRKLRTSMTSKDKSILIYNKIDKTEFLFDGSGHANMKAAIKSVNDLYTGIFEPFRNNIPFVNLFAPYNCDFTIFQTGDYSDAQDGTSVFQQGSDVYPRRLWKIIMKHVKG